MATLNSICREKHLVTNILTQTPDIVALSRGARTDYDAWEALGNPGWGWESMFEYFKKSSTLTYPIPELVDKYDYIVSPEGYGKGPMQAGFPSWQFPALSR